jgi:hypothetical protein
MGASGDSPSDCFLQVRRLDRSNCQDVGTLLAMFPLRDDPASLSTLLERPNTSLIASINWGTKLLSHFTPG